ncbi:hypothetical protein [Streptomyces sp. TP-A0356]|uniref:hypothetical protein n=1 Tax=Streptomyces sp. TP-A0356 TaxID=1359208 RepID=UPI0007C8758A
MRPLRPWPHPIDLPCDPSGAWCHLFDPLPHPTAFLAPEPAQRLALPEELTPTLGYDAVGIPREHGVRIMNCLPRVGCVFADDLRWWWIVPSGSHIGVVWPSSTSYAVDACVGRYGGPEPDVCRADPSWSGPRPVRP